MLGLVRCSRVASWSRPSVAIVHRRLLSSTVPAPPYRILFCGTDSFAAKNLEALIQHGSELCPELHVLTPPDVEQTWGAKRMRVSLVKLLAQQHNLPHQQVPLGGMTNYSLPPDLVAPSPSNILLTCSFGHMIPDSLLQAFPHPYQRLNIHPSLLPQLRGAAPIQWAISRRFTTSGVSIQSLESRRFDTGRIFAQHKIPFPPPEVDKNASYLEIEGVMADYAAKLIVQVLQDLPTFVRHSWEQDPNAVSRAPKIQLADCKIECSTMSAEQIAANHRAFSYLYPLNCNLISQQPIFPDVEVSIHQVDTIGPTELQSTCLFTYLELFDAEPGWALYSRKLDAIIVKCHDDEHLLRIHSLQSKGKKLKSAKQWWITYRDRSNDEWLLRFQ